MSYRSLSAALSVCVVLGVAVAVAAQETPALSTFAIRPGQKIYVTAIKGECEAFTGVENNAGQVAPIPGSSGTVQAGGQAKRESLTRYEPDKKAGPAVQKEFMKDGRFVLTDAPEKADFVFHVCTAYTENILPMVMVEQSGVGSRVMFSRVMVVPAAPFSQYIHSYPQLRRAAIWSADSLSGRQDKSDKKNKTKKKDKREDQDQEGAPAIIKVRSKGERVPQLFINGQEKQKSPIDLTRHFLKVAATIAPVSLPSMAMGTQPAPTDQVSNGMAPADGQRRPAFANKPDDGKVTSELPGRVPNNQSSILPSTADAAPAAKPSTTLDTTASGETIRLETSLVSVPVSILDKDGRFVPDLTRKDFRIFENEVEQEIEQLGTAEAPFSVVLLLDTSRSTGFKIEDIQDAALAFVDQLRPQDQVLVVSFEDRVWVDSEFTNDRNALKSAIRRTRAGGNTRLYDALDLVLTERLNRVQGRKAVVLLSDGIDTTSKFAVRGKTLALVEESYAPVYSVRYDTWEDVKNLPPPAKVIGINRPKPSPLPTPGLQKEDHERGAAYLRELAARSGGRYYEAATIQDAHDAFAKIAEELRRQYWLRYYPSNTARDDSWRSIRVRVAQPGLVVRARKGYRATRSKGGK